MSAVESVHELAEPPMYCASKWERWAALGGSAPAHEELPVVEGVGIDLEGGLAGHLCAGHGHRLDGGPGAVADGVGGAHAGLVGLAGAEAGDLRPVLVAVVGGVVVGPVGPGGDGAALLFEAVAGDGSAVVPGARSRMPASCRGAISGGGGGSSGSGGFAGPSLTKPRVRLGATGTVCACVASPRFDSTTKATRETIASAAAANPTLVLRFRGGGFIGGLISSNAETFHVKPPNQSLAVRCGKLQTLYTLIHSVALKEREGKM